MQLPIIYRDHWLLALNKPANLLSVPAKDPHKPNCYQWVLRHYPKAKIIHRLDEPTSGILLFALNNEVEQQLHQQFRQQEIKKSYIAVVQGKVCPRQGKVTAPLSIDWPNRPKQKICWQQGKQSLTQWSVIRYDKMTTRMKLIPYSGRTHQLRLHMQFIGHPIIGDRLYNLHPSTHWYSRLLLHAKSLILRHPITMTELHLTTLCPF